MSIICTSVYCWTLSEKFGFFCVKLVPLHKITSKATILDELIIYTPIMDNYFLCVLTQSLKGLSVRI